MTGPQREFYRSRRRLRLTYGARASGKTIGVEHTVMRHAWRHNARIAIILKTTRTGSFGVWPELTNYIYQQWIDAGIGSDHGDFGWISKPHKDTTTKIHRAVLRNRYGNGSEIVLFPIEHPVDALDKLLSTEWSCVWLSEGHLYRDTKDCKARTLFDSALGQLRLKGVDFDDTILMVDTNPPEEGTKHWLYDIFFRERTMSEWPDYFTKETIEAFKRRQSEMHVVRVPLDSNTFLHPGLRAQIISQYAHDPFLYRRYVLAEWIDGVVTGLFEKAFSRAKHVFGNADAADQDEWEVIALDGGPNVVNESGLPLVLGGWDLGDVNHAWTCVQPVWVGDQIHFRVVDELVVIHNEVSIDEFGELVKERIEKIQQEAGFPIEWRHYSDSSAFEFRAAIRRKDLPVDAEMTDAAIIENVTGIMLEGSAEVKKPGWQRRRVTFLAQLMRENRLAISAGCKEVIRMCTSLRKAEGAGSRTFLDTEQDVKHAFDAVSYPICMFALDEILAGDGPPGLERQSSHVQAA